jgi:peroxiredoxin
MTDSQDNRRYLSRSTPGRYLIRLGRTRWFELAAVLLIILLSINLVLLTLQNREYEKILSRAGLSQADEIVRPGSQLENIDIVTLEGHSATLSVSDENKRFLLFVLSTTCPHCLANLPRWDSISRTLSSSGLYIVGLSIHKPEETMEYVAEQGVSFYTVSVSDTAFLERYMIPGVPATLLLATGGIVEQVWIGELSEDQVSEVINHVL